MTKHQKNNLAFYIHQQIIQQKDKTALIMPNEKKISYADLAQCIAEFQTGLQQQDLKTGDRVLLLFPVSIDLYALIIALLGLGLIPVFIDMGFGFKKALTTIKNAKINLIISTPALLKMQFIFPALWKLTLKLTSDLKITTQQAIIIEACDSQQQGIITFTSGTTGQPKGTDRTHSSLIAQHLAIRSHWQDQPNDIDMPCFPMVVLHNLCCGITTVLPEIDFKQPAAVKPELIIQQIQKFKITRLSGAPAYIKKITDYLLQYPTDLPSLKSVLIGGSTVNQALCTDLIQVFNPTVEINIVYGSTEAEPISHIQAKEILANQGEGYLVGKAVPQTQVMIVNLPPVFEAENLLNYQVKAGEVGEILVAGDHVLRGYIDNKAATKELKIISNQTLWHRTGDLAYQDQKEQLWLMGRTADKPFPYPIEIEIDQLIQVKRSALVSCQNKLILAIELMPNQVMPDNIKILETIEIRQVEQIPVDKRHNSKINRPQLCQELKEKPFIIQLNRVDLLTLSNVFICAFASALILKQQFSFALSLLFFAMFIDAMDGILARKWGLTRDFGRYLDGFIDVLIYLTTPVLFLYQWGFHCLVYDLILICFLISGLIRLAVFNQVGNLINMKTDKLSYWGMPVFWSLFILGGAYLGHFIIPLIFVFPFLAIALSMHTFFMLYNRRFYKFQSLKPIFLLTLGGSLLFLGLGLLQYA